MCGIAGMFQLAPRGEAGRARLPEAVREMVRCLGHRGPDGVGVWSEQGVALGHARLAIIDLSEAAGQPFVDRETGIVLVYNGEVYNYRELRAELAGLGHAFRTQSDTEVVLRALVAWGPEAVTRFVGMWAFAAYDPRDDSLLLSRDRFGIKPLYYAVAGGTLVFASELRPLLDSGLVSRQADHGVARRFLLTGATDVGDRTFFAGVERVPAASYARITRQGAARPTFRRYWSAVPAGDAPPADYAAAVREVRARLESSVELHLRSDVPVGMCLSGGLDSSALVALSARQLAGVGAPPRTFTAVFPGLPIDETPYAASVVAQTGVSPEWIAPTAATLEADLDALVRCQEEPFASTGVYLQWKLFERMHAVGIKVVLDGQGADEAFGGYASFLAPQTLDLVGSGHLGGAARNAYEVLRHRRSLWRGRGLAAMARGALRATGGGGRGSAESWLGEAVRSAPVAPAPIDAAAAHAPTRFRRAVLDYLTRHSLPALLRYEDRNSMCFSVESRVPYLDHRLVEYALALPDDYLLDRGVAKRVLRDAVRDALPTLVTERRDKLGFASPTRDWVRDVVSRRLGGLLAEPFARDYVDPASVRRMLDGRTPAAEDTTALWRTYSVLEWHRLVLAAPSGVEARRERRPA